MTVITPCRPATPDEIPANARTLAALAEANGWEVAITYVRGVWTRRKKSAELDDGKARMLPTEVTEDTVAVRMWREGKLVAVWTNGAFDFGGSQYRGHSLAELRHMVAMTRPELEEWHVAQLEEEAA